MTKYLLAAAAMAAIAISGAAFAEDGKVKSTAPQAMTDTEMDQVTAGIQPTQPGLGQVTAGEAQGLAIAIPPAGTPGYGKITAEGVGN